jgi:hypothetical protein
VQPHRVVTHYSPTCTVVIRNKWSYLLFCL